MLIYCNSQVPVELTIPHAACPGSEVSAVSRSSNTTNWKEDTARDGPSFVQASTDTVTLKINHFTGFKISDTGGKRAAPSGKSQSTTRSRIPLPLRVSVLLLLILLLVWFLFYHVNYCIILPIVHFIVLYCVDDKAIKGTTKSIGHRLWVIF